MNRAAARCPGAGVLARYSKGLFAESHRKRIAQHIASCPACYAALSGPPEIEIEPDLDIEEEEQTQIHSVPPPVRAVARHPTPAAPFRPVLRENTPPVAFRALSPPLPPPPPDEAPTRIEPVNAESAMTVQRPSTYPSHPSDTEVGDELQPPGQMQRGTAIGRYLIVEPLGAGGLGDVYTAYDPELDRRIALKLLRPTSDPAGSSQGSSSGGGDRLIREAKAMARLAHPNVVAVHDVGRRDDDVFIAMERVEGDTLSRWLRVQQRPWQEIRDMFVGAGRGLAAAHAAGIIHRDFKPQNVIVGEDGRPRVLDFGLARSVQREQRSGLLRIHDIVKLEAEASSAALEDPITLPGIMMGTPQFMAPEQFAGGEASKASDQFSFTVALWLAVYGSRPFQADTIPGLMKAVAAGAVTEPKDRRGVPAWLHRVMLRGLEHDPAQRFASMDDMLYALLRDSRKRRRNWLAVAFVGLLSAAGAGTGAVMLQPQMTAEHRSAIESTVTDARAAAAKSYFVYPAPDDAEAVTAYRKVLELETQDGPSEQAGLDAAEALRDEFSATLTRLGDRYYDREGGRAFAADYYAAALIFDPGNPTAGDRSTLTPGELAVLREKAASGDFSEAELAAAASLKVLAIEDEEERKAQLKELYEGDNAPSPSTSARLEALLSAEEAVVVEEATERRKKRRTKKPVVAKAETPAPRQQLPVAQPPPPPPPATEPVPEPEQEIILSEAPAEKPGKGRDPETASELAQQGMAALRKAKFGEAEALFHRALSHQRRNATALGGLAELYFERGSYQKAVTFGSKAVGAAPRSAKYRVILGDAYFKTLAYASARREYEKAVKLGSSSAKSRLSQLEKRLGN